MYGNKTRLILVFNEKIFEQPVVKKKFNLFQPKTSLLLNYNN